MKIDLKKPSNSLEVKGKLKGVRGYLYGLYIKTNLRHIMTFEWYCYYFCHFCSARGWEPGRTEADNFAFFTAITPDIEKALNRVKKTKKVFR